MARLAHCLGDIKKGGESVLNCNVKIINEREGRKDWEVR